MSQHSVASIISTTSTGTAATPTTTVEESSTKSCPSTTGSLKKQKNKDAEEPITDDFVLMSTPEKFKDQHINETKAAKKYRCDSAPNEKINLECLLLSDTSMQCGTARHVEIILQHFHNNCPPSQAELLFVLLYIVALESGYAGQSDYEQDKYYLNHLMATSSYHSKNILRLSRFKPGYRVTEDKTRFVLKLHTLVDVAENGSHHLYSLLTGVVTGDFLIVTLSPATSTEARGFSTALSIGRYILSVQAKNKPLQQRFRKLDELSYILRDQVFVPMRCQQLGLLNHWVFPSLDGMTFEFYEHISKYLSKNQLKILANVNKSLSDVTKNIQVRQQSIQ